MSIALGAGDDSLTMSNTDGNYANIDSGDGTHDKLFGDDTVHFGSLLSAIWRFEERHGLC